MDRQLIRQTRIPVPWSQWTAVLACSMLLSGCQLLQSAPTEEIRQPPLIPEPVGSQPVTSDVPASQPTFIGTYADLSELDDASQYHPQLKAAVSQALQLGVLKPMNPEERFEPQRPVHFGEFRQWTLAYQSAISGKSAKPKETNLPPAKELVNFSQPPAPDGINPMDPQNLMVLPSSVSWAGHTLTESRSLTRQELCALYVFLTRQESKAQALTAEQIEASHPGQSKMGGEDINQDEALAQFTDYQGISRWAKRYVALAYRDGVLQQVFRLTPPQLTVDTGFSPTREVSREEAIILLNQLYGRAKPVKNNPTAEPIGPVSHLESVREFGPNGSRTAIRTSRPE